MGSILGRDSSSIQVSWNSVELFFCHPADKPTKKQTDMEVKQKSVVTLKGIYAPF